MFYTFPYNSSATCCLASEWVKFPFCVCTCLRSKTYSLKYWSMFCDVKFTFSILYQWFCGLARFLLTSWLHKNACHAFCATVHFQTNLLVRYKWYNTGGAITSSFEYSNIVINFVFHYSFGIVFWEWFLKSFMSGFILISKYGAYLKYKLIGPIK